MVRLAEYSRDCLRALRAETGIAYDERSRGTLQLFRTQKQLDDTGKDIEILQQYGVPFQLLGRDGYHASTNRRWPTCRKSSSAHCACRTTKPATASSSRRTWRGWPRAWACAFASA